jgi:hypothetical protein
MVEIYIPIENYQRAVQAIAARTGLAPDEIKIALGEQASIWPESIRGDAERSMSSGSLQHQSWPRHPQKQEVSCVGAVDHDLRLHDRAWLPGHREDGLMSAMAARIPWSISVQPDCATTK